MEVLSIMNRFALVKFVMVDADVLVSVSQDAVRNKTVGQWHQRLIRILSTRACPTQSPTTNN